ncbi:MAG: glycine cleavage system aminomethyltransferase GcvT [Xanthobacteraceae bacterium]
MTDPHAPDPQSPLRQTPLYRRHVQLGARMVPFAGYDMPVQYPDGIIAEHTQTRTAAGLFDVSHMGQGCLSGPDHETIARALEALTPADILGLAPGQQRYTQLLNEEGGILDDLMVTRPADPYDHRLLLVVNASRKQFDYGHIEAHLPADVRLTRFDDRGLLALQGPLASLVLERFLPEVGAMPFMTAMAARFDGIDCAVSRSGYTGEDGFELSVGAEHLEAVFDRLLDTPDVKPVGLGARDTLRLEAGLCLYGHDIDETTSPVEAGLAWSIGKRRRTEGGFPGAARVQRELADGPSRRRVGILPEGRAPAREGAPVLASNGGAIGLITSGGFGPTVKRPVAMGYVDRAHATPGTAIAVVVRDKPLAASVSPLPFVPHRYHRQKGTP